MDVGIDDFAIKKKHHYGTIMIDQVSKKIIDMIDSRDINDVSLWLQSYPNLKTISRDGSVQYKAAIEIANNEIKQISDRFHLIKGLSEAACNEIDRIFPSSFTVEKIDINIEAKKSLKERFLSAKKAIEKGASISKACIDNDLNWRTFNKINSFSESEFKEYFDKKENNTPKSALLSKERKERKKDIIDKVNKLYESGMSERKIAKTLNISRCTVSKYLDLNYSKHLMSQRKRKNYSILDKHEKTIIEMLSQNASQKSIYLKLKQDGYEGCYSNLRMFIKSHEIRNKMFLEIDVSRSDIKSLIFHKRNENILSREHLVKVLKEYPKLKKVLEIFFEFKDILLNHKSKDRLEKWISKIKKKEFTYIDSFVNGIKRDLEAVVNSLTYKNSNGITESKVNVTKLNKRKMYGRCSFKLLKNKTLLMEKYYQ